MQETKTQIRCLATKCQKCDRDLTMAEVARGNSMLCDKCAKTPIENREPLEFHQGKLVKRR